MKRGLLVTFLALALVGAALRDASAQEETKQSLDQARDAFDQGQSLFEKGDFEAAAEKFKAAHAARAFPQFLFNVGVCYEKANRYRDAIDYYHRYLKADPDADDAASVKKRIAALEKGISEIEAKGGDATDQTQPAPESVRNLEEAKVRGGVIIESEPAGALIYLDSKKNNEPLAKTPFNGTLSGSHTLMLEREGYKPVERDITVEPERFYTFFFQLAEEDYLGWVDITSNVPGADIYIDDKSVGVYRKTPFSGNLTPGKHRIWVTKEGYNEFYKEVDVVAGETHKVEAVLQGSEVGYLNIRGTGVEKVSVYMDGELLCERGPCREPVPQGEHTVTIVRSGYKSYSQTVDMQSKTEVTMRARLAPEPGRGDAVVAYLIAGAFIGGGVWAGMQAQGIEDDLAAEIAAGMPPPADDDPRFQRGKWWSWGANAGYALGGISLMTAIYYTFRDKGAPSTGTTDVRAVSIEPALAPGYAGLGMGVSW